MYLRSILFLLLFFPSLSFGQELYNSLRSVRALGMGNAYQSVVNDSDSLFYNPAGLAKARGVNLSLANIGLGLGGLEAAKEVEDFAGSNDISGAIAQIFGEPISGYAAAKIDFTIPYFSMAAYGYSDVSLVANNPVSPDLDVGFITDYGAVAGVGFPLFRWLHIGGAARYIVRQGVRDNFDSGDLIGFDPQPIADAIESSGEAIAYDAGLSFVYSKPNMELTLSGVLRNIGGTEFELKSGAVAPTSEEEELSVSASLLFDAPGMSLLGVADYRYANRDDIDDTKKMHIGAELGLALFDFRVGLHQGYFSYGFGLNMGIVQLDLASYRVELGERAGQIEDQRYMAQISIELGYSRGRFNKYSTSGSKSTRVKNRGRRRSRYHNSLKQRR